MDEVAIYRLVREKGFVPARAALAGYRKEVVSDRYDPRRYLGITRLFKNLESFERLVNSGLADDSAVLSANGISLDEMRKKGMLE
jgi:hypothetical protein